MYLQNIYVLCTMSVLFSVCIGNSYNSAWPNTYNLLFACWYKPKKSRGFFDHDYIFLLSSFPFLNNGCVGRFARLKKYRRRRRRRRRRRKSLPISSEMRWIFFAASFFLLLILHVFNGHLSRIGQFYTWRISDSGKSDMNTPNGRRVQGECR